MDTTIDSANPPGQQHFFYRFCCPLALLCCPRAQLSVSAAQSITWLIRDIFINSQPYFTCLRHRHCHHSKFHLTRSCLNIPLGLTQDTSRFRKFYPPGNQHIPLKGSWEDYFLKRSQERNGFQPGSFVTQDLPIARYKHQRQLQRMELSIQLAAPLRPENMDELMRPGLQVGLQYFTTFPGKAL